MTVQRPVRGRLKVVLPLLLFSCLAFGEAPAGPTLKVAGDHFTVDGDARFLVLVSYFDATRASDAALDDDFAYVRSVGVDGIRIFPNWWNWPDMRHFPNDTLMDGRGALRPDRLARLKSVLEKAAAHGLVVDVSFAYETVGGLSDLQENQLGTSQGNLPVNQVHAADYERGLSAAAAELRRYRHVFFDIQNEFNGRITHLSDDEARRLGLAIKKADPKRIVTASLANEIGPEDVAKRSDSVDADVVGWHESRNPWQFESMDQLVRRARRVSGKPIYLGEPASVELGYTSEQCILAVTKAKAGGAAAWTFHTQNGFDLRDGSIHERLTEAERSFLESFRIPLDNAPWGIAKSVK